MSGLPHADRPMCGPAADCWNHVGVLGDGSCHQLSTYIHCRNCPAWSAAASGFLDVESTDGYRRQCTEQIAQGKPLTAANHLSMLVFRLCEEWFCVPTAVLKEIVGIRPVHSVPHRRNGVLIGLANVRGELLPCFSLQHVLGMDGAVGSVSKTSDEDGPARGRLLVLLREGSRAVCPVSEVHGIVHFDPQTVMPASSTITRAASAYTRSVLTWQQHLVGVLSDELLFRSFNRSLA